MKHQTPFLLGTTDSNINSLLSNIIPVFVDEYNTESHRSFTNFHVFCPIQAITPIINHKKNLKKKTFESTENKNANAISDQWCNKLYKKEGETAPSHTRKRALYCIQLAFQLNSLKTKVRKKRTEKILTSYAACHAWAPSLRAWRRDSRSGSGRAKRRAHWAGPSS